MPLDFLIDRIDELPATRALAAGLPGPGSRIPVSGLPGSSPAVLVAALARRFPQRVFVVITSTPTDAERWLADARALAGDAAAALYPQREALVVQASGPIWAAIVEVADDEDAGMIVMGSRGLTGLRHLLLGSVSEGVVRHGRRTSLVVHPDGDQ